MTVAVESWMEEPMLRYVRDSDVTWALMAHPSGHVLAQVGFLRAADVMAVCALAAAINQSSAELGRMLEGRPFRGLHLPGETRQAYLASGATARGPYLLLSVFDATSSLGLVNMYLEEFRASVADAAPPAEVEQRPALAEDFERDLHRNLESLFGKAS